MSSSASNLDFLTVGQAQKEVSANALLDALSPASLYGRRASYCSGLVWGFYGGQANTTGGLASVANNTLTLTASSTNYIEADPASGAVTFNTSSFTAGKTPLYSAVVGTETVTSYVDYRITSPRVFRNLNKPVDGAVDVTLTQIEVASELVTFSGAITANINVILPSYAFVWHIFNNTSGAFTVTCKTAAGTGIVIAQGKRAILSSDGTNIVRFSADI